jgi:osmoprotectant transport system permease protein
VTGPLFEWDWAFDHLGEIGQRLVEHLWLTVIAVVVGFAISFPTAVYVFRHRRVYPPVTWITGLLYTIPSLALFAILVPFTGLTTLTAEIGLVSYTLLILIRNIVAGLDAVPEAVKEAAQGMGYTSRQMLWRIEVPLAVPVIVAGLRIATVTTIGLVTVTALVGMGGLGRYILDGLQLFFNTPILIGALLSMALALLVDFALIRAERWLTPWSTGKVSER